MWLLVRWLCSVNNRNDEEGLAASKTLSDSKSQNLVNNSGAPLLSKFGNLSIREILIVT